MKRNGGKNATGSCFLINRKCSTCSGQPSMAKGNKAEENHVSRTSGSDPGQAHMGEKDMCQYHRGRPMRQSLRGTMVTVATTGQLVCKHQCCFTLSQRNSVWLNSTSDSSSAPRFVLAPTTNPNLLSDRRRVRRAATPNTDPTERLLRIINAFERMN